VTSSIETTTRLCAQNNRTAVAKPFTIPKQHNVEYQVWPAAPGPRPCIAAILKIPEFEN
jgi:hypothetical protein